MEVNISKYITGSSVPEIEILIKGEAKTQVELLTNTIKTLISHSDFKNVFNENYQAYDDFLNEILLSIADKVGYENYYYHSIPEEDQKYNENEELIVPTKIKIELLEAIVLNMKKSYKNNKDIHLNK